MYIAGGMHWRASKTVLLVSAWMAVLLLGPAAPGHGDIVWTEDRVLAAEKLAAAMNIPVAEIDSATAGFSPIRGKGVAFGRVGNIFPNRGGSFAVLSTGSVKSADDPGGDLASLKLGRMNDPEDAIEVILSLRPPDGATCLAFDYAFYSEEVPGRAGQGFNDTFVATLGRAESFVEFQRAETGSAAFLGDSSGTVYDKGTALMTAVGHLRVTDFPVARIVLSLSDVADSFYDTAVFIDNFRWLFDDLCQSTPPRPDADEDGLPDELETSPELQAMGADPLQKDIFIEIDYMGQREVCRRSGVCRLQGHTHQPKTGALGRLIDTFLDRGIRLHIDAGPNSIMNPETGQVWGERSRSDKLAHESELGFLNSGNYNWTAFDRIKGQFFSAERRAVFHYAVFAHSLANSKRSGQSRGTPASDLIVSLGGPGSEMRQAGTLMHELGHNLGLDDGGGDRIKYKPNYLSVMNPFFQTRGLRFTDPNGRVKNGRLDYSFETLDSLNEASLDENAGVRGSAEIDGYETRYSCRGGVRTTKINEPIDWNCDRTFEAPVAANINRGSTPEEVLEGHNDWANLALDGGLIGQLDGPVGLPMETQLDGVDLEEDALIPTDFDVEVMGVSEVAQLAGTTQVYEFQIKNVGENADSYDLAASSLLGWADLASVPAAVTLAPGHSAVVSVAVTVPAATPVDTQDEVTLRATSAANDLMADSATTSPYVPENPPVANAGPNQRVECSSQTGTPVTLDGSGSQAPSGGELTYEWTGPFPEGGGKVSGVRPQVTLPLGISNLQLVVNDGIVDSYPDAVTVTVADTIPPVISASLSPANLWPPDHKMREIRATVVATDICTPPVVALASIASSEPDDARGNGDGNTTNDVQNTAVGTADFLFSVRAERSGSGPGRTYTTAYTATDSSGNRSTDQDQVKVPHKQPKP